MRSITTGGLMLRRCAACYLLPAILWWTPSGHATEILTIPQWDLGAGVHDTLNDESDSLFSVTVMNPFQTVFEAQLGISAATGAFDYVWQPGAGTGSFRLDAGLQAQGNSQRFSASAGGAVWVQTGADLLLGIDASFSYFMPPGDREVELEFGVLALNPSSVIYANEQRALGIIGDPPAHTFTIDDTLLLNGGRTYFLRYAMRLVNHGGSPDLLSTGNGHINWTLQPVPEPASAWFAAVGLALALRKRRRAGDPPVE